jgi:hypothetical protein
MIPADAWLVAGTVLLWFAMQLLPTEEHHDSNRIRRR